MNDLFSFLCAVCVSCALVTHSAAQDKTSSTTDRSDEAGTVTTNYDPAKDETTVEFRQLEIPNKSSRRVLLSVSESYAGKKLKSQPEDIIVIFSLISMEDYHFPDVMAMKVSADGKKLADVLMLNLDKRPFNPGYLETMGTRMKFEEFKRLSQAKAVELQLHDLVLLLDEAQISKFRELESRLRKP